jgi:hypothetical protein
MARRWWSGTPLPARHQLSGLIIDLRMHGVQGLAILGRITGVITEGSTKVQQMLPEWQGGAEGLQGSTGTSMAAIHFSGRRYVIGMLP